MAFFPNEWETFHFLRYAVSYPEMAYVWQIQKSDRRSALTETTSRHKPSKHIPSCLSDLPPVGNTKSAHTVVRTSRVKSLRHPSIHSFLSIACQ